MARVAGTLLFELVADVAKLRLGMEDAQKQVSTAMRGIEKSLDVAKSAFGAFAAAAGVGSLGAFMKSAIDAADRLDEMAERTGVAASELSRLELAFKLGGVGSDEMQKTLVKLSVTMNTNADAIEQLGVKTRNTDGTLRGTTEVLRDVADRFQTMDNGARKTALAVEIFGKSGAEIIPVLNLGSEGLDEMARLTEELGMAMTDEGAKAAAELNDKLDLLKLGVQGVGRQAMTDLLPSLSNMATSLVRTATETDLLKDAATVLGVVFKSLFTAIMTVYEALQSVATIATATWQAFMAATRGDFSAAVDIIQKAGTDVSAGWSKTSDIIRNAWNGSASTAIDATSKIVAEAKRNQQASLETAEAQKEAEAAAKKTQAEYLKLAESLDKVTAASRAEIEAGGKLTDAQKLALDVRSKLSDTTIRLTSEQRREIEAKLAAAEAALKDRDAQREAEAARKKLVDSIGKQNEDLLKQIETQKRANEEAGLSTDELRRLEIQRLRDAAATADQNAQLRIQNGINDEITAAYIDQAKNLRSLADLKEQGIHVEAAKQASNAWKETGKNIEDALTGALMRAFESGKGFMDAFKSVLRNSFKTLVLEPTIRGIMAPISAAAGSMFSNVAGAAMGGGGGGGGSMLGNIGSAVAGSGMLGSGIMYGLSSFAAGGSILGSLAGAGSMISGGIAAASLGSVVAGIGAIVGTLGPIALGIALLVKAFGRGPKQTTGAGIQGTIGFGEVTGQQFTDWIKKGGWFRSDKRGTDLATLSKETEDALDRTAAAVFSQANTFAETLGLSTVAIQRVMTSFRVTLGQSEEENEKAIAAVFEQYRQDLAGAYFTLLQPFQKAGETLADTFGRLAAIQVFARSINEFGGAFSRIANLSIVAQEELIAFAGGLENFVRKTQSFVQNFYSQEEQVGLTARAIVQDLARLGITQDVSTRGEFRALVEAQDVSTTRGREIFNALLDIAERFAPISTFLEENKKTLASAAAGAPASALLKNILDASRAEGTDAAGNFYNWFQENWADFNDAYTGQTDASVEFYAAYIKDAELRAKLDKDSVDTLKKILEQEVTNDEYKSQFDDRLLAETQKLLHHTGRLDWHTQTNLIALNEHAHNGRFEYLQLEREAQAISSSYFNRDMENNHYVNVAAERFHAQDMSVMSGQTDRLTALNDRMWWLDHNNTKDQAVIISKLESLTATTETGLAAVATNTKVTADLLDSFDDNGAMRTVTA